MQDTIPAIKVIQNEKEILIFSIPAEELIDISYFNPREIDRQAGIQREFKELRSREIARYLQNEDSVLANNIIINLELEKHGFTLNDIFDERKNQLKLSRIKDKSSKIYPKLPDRKGKIAFVIDGQHRLRAFEYCHLGKFPLVVSALIDLSLAEVAELFVKINYYQKPVNKSLVLDLLGISERIFPQYYKLHEVVEQLNDDIASPFYGKIRMLGLGKGFISQASIITSIEKYKIEKTLLELNIKPTKGELYNLIWNYFKAVEEVFTEHWGDGKYLSKTIGIRALFLLLRDILKSFSEKNIEFSKKNIKNILSKIDENLFDNPDISGLGGEKGVKHLYQRMQNEIEGN